MHTFTTQRRTIVGYRYQGFRGLSPTPQGTNCEMEITEVDEPVSYIVSTGDDGFIAQDDQKIPLCDAAVRGKNDFYTNLSRALCMIIE